MALTLDQEQREVVGNSICVGPHEQGSLTFATIQTTDNDEYLAKSSLSMDAGTIRVTVKRIRNITHSGNPPRHFGSTEGLKSAILHEKNKKAGGHITQLGPVRKVKLPSGSLRYLPYSPADEEPYVTFIFRYRPADILQAQGIMPALKYVPQSLDNPEIDEIDEKARKAQILALEAEEAELEAQRASLIARKAVLVSRATPVKREEIDVRRFFKQGEVIDLTLSP
ncbi:hypothetical protein FRB94_005752 [Tulasnella sp. JGI-2019a]|nr:hypothetical protein FRB94_005752 [Tulasnella sp. JGI-2019a]